MSLPLGMHSVSVVSDFGQHIKHRPGELVLRENGKIVVISSWGQGALAPAPRRPLPYSDNVDGSFRNLPPRKPS